MSKRAGCNHEYDPDDLDDYESEHYGSWKPKCLHCGEPHPLPASMVARLREEAEAAISRAVLGDAESVGGEDEYRDQHRAQRDKKWGDAT